MHKSERVCDIPESQAIYFCVDDRIVHAARQQNGEASCPSMHENTQLSNKIAEMVGGQIGGLASALPARQTPLQRGFEIIAQTYPGAPAVKCHDRTLSYGELDAEADELALDLQREGLVPGSFCTVGLDPSLAQVRAILAIVKAGAAYLQFDPVFPARYVPTILQILQPSVLFVHTSNCFRDSDSAMRIMCCDEDAASLPYGWPDEAPVAPATPAHAFATLAADGAVCLWICTHLGLANASGAMRKPPPLAHCDADPAALWRTLSVGTALTIPPSPAAGPKGRRHSLPWRA